MASGEYVGEHWLATFAVYLLTVPPESIKSAESGGSEGDSPISATMPTKPTMSTWCPSVPDGAAKLGQSARKQYPARSRSAVISLTPFPPVTR